MLSKIIFTALAGGLGTLTRYTFTFFVNQYNESAFPIGTLFVNIIGCFIAGIMLVIFDSKIVSNPELRTIILVGFLGGFTTFSAYMIDINNLIDNSAYMSIFSNVFLQNGVGLIALIIGMKIGSNI